MHQRDLEADAKKTISAFDARIAELKDRIRALETARTDYASAIVNYTLNSAQASSRDCCGNEPRKLAFGGECKDSPVGICVYKDDKDPSHDHCLFCRQPEKR